MNKKYAISLILILVLAGFFRLWRLNEIPPGLYPDVAINGNDALETLKTKNFKLFYPENNGREGLFMWLIALSFSIFGVSIWSIKIVAAISGILTVLGLFLLVKELFDDEFLALLASFFLAISFSHNIFSRLGFRAILLPFVLVFSFYFLLKGFRTKRKCDFIISGIFFGLGFYTYISFRFAILILPAVLIPYWFIYKKQNLKKKFLLFTFYFLVVTFLVALPIGIYFLKHPQDFVGRATPISVFAQENPVKSFFQSLVLHLGMFNFHGDGNWRHNFSGSPMLFWSLSILFLIGIFISIRELKKSIENKNLLPVTGYSLLFIWLFAMMLPGILTAEGVPHFLRVIGVIPVTYIFVALAGEKIYQFLASNAKSKSLLVFACLFLLSAISFSEFNKYFVHWGKNPEVEGAFTKRYAEIGHYLNSLPEEIKKYVIINEFGVPLYGISIPAQTPIFIENSKFGHSRSTYLKAEDLNQIQMKEKAIIIPLYNGKLSEEIVKRFPSVAIEEKNSFTVYRVENNEN